MRPTDILARMFDAKKPLYLTNNIEVFYVIL